MESITDVLELAQTAHKGQVDLLGNDYFTYHVNEVANNASSIMLEFGIHKILGWVMYDQILDVAYLHDILEDTEVTYEYLKTNINIGVADSVRILTRFKHLTYDEYINRIIKSHDLPALVVKIADLRTNLNILRFQKVNKGDLNRLNKYLAAYHKLLNILEDRINEVKLD